MLPGFDLAVFAQHAGAVMAVLVIAAIIFSESGLLIGFFLPGDSILFTAGFLVHTGILNVNIHLLVLVVFAAAVFGDSVGYTFGKRVGRKLFKRRRSILFKQENIVRAEEFYEKHGPKTIIIARFIPIIRTFAPIVAGVGKMTYKQFVTYNIIGGFLWAVGITYAGFFVGSGLEKIGVDVDAILLPIIALIVLASVTPPIIHILKDKKRRKILWLGTKREIKILLRREKRREATKTISK